MNKRYRPFELSTILILEKKKKKKRNQSVTKYCYITKSWHLVGLEGTYRILEISFLPCKHPFFLAECRFTEKRELGQTQPQGMLCHSASCDESAWILHLSSQPPRSGNRWKRGLCWKGPYLPTMKICNSGLCWSLVLEGMHIWPANAHPREISGKDILVFYLASYS